MPFVSGLSKRDPASIQTPTVAVRAARFDSVATRRPFGRVVILVAGAVRMELWSAMVG